MFDLFNFSVGVIRSFSTVHGSSVAVDVPDPGVTGKLLDPFSDTSEQKLFHFI